MLVHTMLNTSTMMITHTKGSYMHNRPNLLTTHGPAVNQIAFASQHPSRLRVERVKRVDIPKGKTEGRGIYTATVSHTTVK
jgi:hypothetical protein